MSRHAPERAPLNRSGNRSDSRGSRNPEAEEAGEKYALTSDQLGAAAALGISPRSAARIAGHHARKLATQEPAALTRVSQARRGSVPVGGTVGERVAAELTRERKRQGSEPKDSDERRAAYIRRLVAEAPPLTTARSAELAALLSAGGGR